MGPRHGIYEDRVREHTAGRVNEKIDQKTERNIRQYSAQQLTAISRRLSELDREWDLDRALMATFAAVGVGALELHRRSRPLGTVVLGAQVTMLLLHALVGWCPPVRLLRRLRFRTQKEIGVERRALLDALERRLPPTA